MSDWVLDRPTRTVFDVGSGEGQWRHVLKRLRRSIQYEGIDPSEYAVSRFGRRRNIRLGDIESISVQAQRTGYDLVVCCGMLNYLSAAQLERGLRQVAAVTAGVAYLELFTASDSFEGDTSWPKPRRTRWYRELLADAGFTPIGMQCYVTAAMLPTIASLERLTDQQCRTA